MQNTNSFIINKTEVVLLSDEGLWNMFFYSVTALCSQWLNIFLPQRAPRFFTEDTEKNYDGNFTFKTASPATKRLFFIVFFAFLLAVSGFAQQINDTTRAVRSWQLSDDGYTLIPEPVDTLPDLWCVYHPLLRKSITNTWLGNIGLAGISNIYFERENNNPFIFIIPFIAYETPTAYFDTRKHFTGIRYYTNGSKERSEQDMEIIHAQNINAYFNAGFRYRLFSSAGQYAQQTARDNSLSFFTSYTRRIYTLHATFRYNKFRVSENGGLASEDYVLNDSFRKSQLIPVNLIDVRNIIATKSLEITHGLRFGTGDTVKINDSTFWESYAPKICLLHTVRLEYDKKIYTDNNPSYYPNEFLDTVSTFDSAAFRKMENFVQLRSLYHTGSVLPGYFLGAGSAWNEYYSTVHNANDSMLHFSPSFHDLYAAAGIFRDSSAWKYHLSAKYFVSGRRTGNMYAGGFLLKEIYGTKDTSEISLDASFSISSPSWFEEQYSSNHIRWDTVFLDRQETRFSLTYRIPAHHLEIGVQTAILDNFVYFDTTAHPAQNTHTFNIYSAYAEKLFKAGKWRFQTRVVWQESGNDNVLPLPAIAVFHSTWFEFKVFKKVLLIQPGFDFYYSTAFYAPSYYPATNLFYLQKRKEYGNYPWADVSINFRLKRARFFVKLEHVNEGLTGNNYFSAPGYPLYKRSMRFGISWNFYD